MVSVTLYSDSLMRCTITMMQSFRVLYSAINTARMPFLSLAKVKLTNGERDTIPRQFDEMHNTPMVQLFYILAIHRQNAVSEI